jgi:hypothetical protein
MSSELRNELDIKYEERFQKIREAGAAAIRQLDKLRSTGPTSRETLDAEVAQIAGEAAPLWMRSRCSSDG